MALIRINPIKFRVGGDETRAMDYLGVARSQMNILLQDMSFQRLNQGVRRTQIAKDVFIECRKIFNYQECNIFVTEEALTTTHFFIIFATGSGEEAVLWDLSSDIEFSPVDSTLTSIRTKLLEIRDTADVEAVYPETDSHTWNVISPNDTHDSPIILPSYISGFYDLSLGYEWTLTTLYPADVYWDYLGRPQTIEWDFDYIDVSPLPYPLKKQVDGEEKENNEKASYINSFMGRVDSTSALTAEFETLTGVTWPAGTDVWRYFHYWHPLFWYSMKDVTGNYTNLSTYGRGVLLSDTWADGEWGSGASLDKSSLVWHNAGIATMTVDSNIESVLFEYVSVCHKFVDTFGTGMCDTALSEFDEYLRFYEHGKNRATGMQKEILDGTNAFRTGEGTHELVYNSILAESAQRHASDIATIADTAGIGHIGTDGSTADERITDAGYFTWIDVDLWGYKISENVGYNSAEYTDHVQTVLTDWQNSPGHWANIIDEQVSEMGVGVAVSPEGRYVFVQNFGKVDHRYPGYSPFDPANLKAYVDENFVFDPAHETTRMPRVYMVGTVELTPTQLQSLQGE